MHIIRDEKQATFTFIPVEAEEEQVIKSIVEKLQPEDFIFYGGKSRDKIDKSCIIYLHAGSHEEERSRTEGKITINHWVYVGGVKLTLIGTTKDDKHEVGCIRDTCYFSTGGLIFLKKTEVDDKIAIVVTAMRCKHCNAGMIDMGSCEWKTCDACAEKCQHTYSRGAIHGGGIDIGVGDFCDKCGRARPKEKNEREKSVIEQHLAVEKELGMNVFYKDSQIQTPKQAVEYERLKRRYKKSVRRSVKI